MFRTIFRTTILASLVLAGLAVPARAQDVLTKESAAALKASFVADLETLHTKFAGLASAFPQDKYTWRPMEGVRSVAEVLMLAAFEGYSLVPTSFGGKAAGLGSPEDAAKLGTVSERAQIIENLNRGFAQAKKELEAVDPATLTGKRKIFGQDRSAADGVILIGGDL